MDAFEIPPEILALHARRDAAERPVVRELGERIGYGRVMQLCEELWREKQPGGEHTVGPGGMFMVPCPHPEGGNLVGCDWCCGSGRITRRIAEIAREGLLPPAAG